MDIYTITIILVCLVFSAFFSGMEIAYISSDKLHIELLNQKGSFVGRVLAVFERSRARFLTTTLVGNNLALVLYGIFMAKLIEPILTDWLPVWLAQDIFILVLQTIVATILVLITAEFIPKSLFLLNPNFMLTILALPMIVIYFLMFPIVKFVETVSKLIIVHILRFEYSESRPVYGLTDLNNYIKKNIVHTVDNEPEIDTKIFNNAIEFRDVKVRECMIPRTEIIAVDVNDDIDDLRDAFIESGHSKIVIYKETIDDVIGYCHSLEMFKKPENIKKILTPIIIVPETTPANELLIQFINDRKSLALVVDEFGGTSGIVSMEDVMEEIFGEIRDEHDDEFLIEEARSENEYIFSARHEVDYLNETYHLNLPEGDYDTLGGLILNYYEDLPEEGELINFEDFKIKIISMEDKRIDRVELIIKDREDTL
jgi:CBS domain containing-hemolysin-like protein